MQTGILYATLAYVTWGVFPVYFHQVASVPALEVVLHRTLWSMVLLAVVLAARRQLAWVAALRRQPRVVAAFLLSALLLSANWLIYVWAVHHQHVVDASLGYFILPLVNVAMGYAFLHERPRPGQWLALAVAAAGVLWLTVQAGRLPWIALVLALTFGFYGLLRKTAVLGAMEGLALETALLAPLAVGGLAWLGWTGQAAWRTADAATLGWLVAAGPITAIPLLLFAAGARRIPLATMGVLQYISPSLQFALGVWLFGEAVQPARLAGFVLIWAALVLYTLEGTWRRRRVAVP
ncbi:EamA family transporter RarD [Paracidovorax citrulli]|uniref:RarD protein, DMT superfamily transporter n=2 Tax=Paracidovorax citrulli TaxID=80869 RepID=A1TKK1_PARC0|nr:EamA family transporter RarD [Paracidovorax citrulli]ABM31489.1 RarD protein, DMT superfamily transporter [Paracidovorax citrulli AAC00-1]ATG95410.1 protein RarD [Paracidovorax citrulli]MVT29421.1 EamA family transporter RarD [Paracidovorax citrulli]MVT38125.1 EamA family transporter RarD [Paracidovorax citrulli]PVY65674.1 chloramphenicol-sensitive protein RarD [Paracidovorax citrulli]